MAEESAQASGDQVVVAVPKGRILGELRPMLSRAGLEPEPAFDDPESRQLYFATNRPGVSLIRVRAFDVATFVAFGAAQLGVAGLDVVLEVDDPEIYAPLDLGIGYCRLSVAAPAADAAADTRSWSHLRVATKYPQVAQRHFAARGLQAECIKLNGALELAPQIGLSRRIVDLVSTGRTLRDNGLVEVDTIAEVTSRLIVNRTAFKTRPELVQGWLERFREAQHADAAE